MIGYLYLQDGKEAKAYDGVLLYTSTSTMVAYNEPGCLSPLR